LSDKFLVYVCEECGKPPKQKIIHSMPSIGGEYKNMYDLPSDRKWLIETKEGNLMGVCSGNEKLCKFNIIDDTYIVQIPSILKLKKQLGDLPIPPVDPNFKVKSRFKK
tara:strand:+ start:369 stop:692 length:324 start_codon:yes stop_codon:yes gene_type:complete